MPRCGPEVPPIMARLAAVGDGPPGRFRLKKALKLAGRWLRLKCLDLRPDGAAGMLATFRPSGVVPVAHDREALAELAKWCGLRCELRG